MRFGIREAIFVIVLLAVPAAALYFVFLPRSENIRQAMAEIEIKSARLQKLDQIRTKINDIGLALEAGREAIEYIESKLPSQQGVDLILEQVWQIAKDNRLTQKSFKSEKPVPAAQYRELPKKIVLEGDFDGFYQFLMELENLPRITRIHQLSLQKEQGANSNLGAGSIRAEFTLSIYFEPEAAMAQ